MTKPPIIPANTAIETFRDNGYKNTASAISELIDNSIDAKAKNIKILVFERTITKSNRPMKQISETGKGPENQTPSAGCSIKWKNN